MLIFRLLFFCFPQVLKINLIYNNHIIIKLVEYYKYNFNEVIYYIQELFMKQWVLFIIKIYLVVIIKLYFMAQIKLYFIFMVEVLIKIKFIFMARLAFKAIKIMFKFKNVSVRLTMFMAYTVKFKIMQFILDVIYRVKFKEIIKIKFSY